jgi:hypothetical protein
MLIETTSFIFNSALQDSIKSSNDSASSAQADSLLKTSTNKKPFRFIDDDPDTTSALKEEQLGNRAAPLEGPHIFAGHALIKKHESARPLNIFTSDWFSISLLIVLVLFTWFRVFYYRIFRQLFSSYFSLTATNQIVRDESVLLQRASLIISIISYLLAGLFLYQLSVLYDWQLPYLQKGLIRFAVFSVGVALAYSVKMVLLRFLSVVFYQEKAAALYIFNVFLMILFSGLLLLPTTVLLAYAPAEFRGIIVTISLIVLAVLFVYRLIRAIGIWLGIPGFSIFYLFLYLCTFEIAPLMIIWKLAF